MTTDRTSVITIVGGHTAVSDLGVRIDGLIEWRRTVTSYLTTAGVV